MKIYAGFFLILIGTVFSCVPSLAQKKDPNPAGQYLAKGSVLFEQGKVQASLDEYDKAIKASNNPKYQSFAYVCKGLIKYSSKLQDDYLLDFKKAVMLSPTNPIGNYEYGKHLLENGQRELGIRHLEIAKKLYLAGMSKEKIAENSMLWQQANSEVIRIETLLNMAKNGYRKKSPAYTEARILIEERELAKAIDVLNKGILENQKNGELYHLRGEAFLATRQFDKAMDDAEKAIQYAKNDMSKADGILLRAKSEFKAQKFEDAERDYKDSINLESRNHIALVSYGQFLLDRKRIDEAIQIFEKSKVIATANQSGESFSVNKYLAIPYVEKARMEVGLKHDKEAEACLIKSLALAPNYAEAHLEYGKLLFAKGDNEGASAHLEKAIHTPFRNMTLEKWNEMEKILKKMRIPRPSNIDLKNPK